MRRRLKLYKISQTANCGYDTYDSAVVVARSEEDARLIHPGGALYSGDDTSDTWCRAHDVVVEELGDAPSHLAASTVVCTSFNAG